MNACVRTAEQNKYKKKKKMVRRDDKEKYKSKGVTKRNLSTAKKIAKKINSKRNSKKIEKKNFDQKIIFN